MDNEAIDIGYREMTVHIGDVAKILADKHLQQDISGDALQTLTDFHAVATEYGMGDDGFIRLTLVPCVDRVQAIRQTTEVLRSVMRGEYTEFNDHEIDHETREASMQ